MQVSIFLAYFVVTYVSYAKVGARGRPREKKNYNNSGREAVKQGLKTKSPKYQRNTRLSPDSGFKVTYPEILEEDTSALNSCRVHENSCS